MTLPLRDGGEINTVASLSLTVSLPHAQKGTHMSRFMIALNEQSHRFRPDAVHSVLEELMQLMEAEEVFLEMEFPVFLKRAAPVTGIEGLLDYHCFFRAMLTEGGHSDKLVGALAHLCADTGKRHKCRISQTSQPGQRYLARAGTQRASSAQSILLIC